MEQIPSLGRAKSHKSGQDGLSHYAYRGLDVMLPGLLGYANEIENVIPLLALLSVGPWSRRSLLMGTDGYRWVLIDKINFSQGSAFPNI